MTGVQTCALQISEVLEPEDEIILTVSTSEEAAYYASQANAELGIEVTLA